MSQNLPSAYGVDVACVVDADPLWSTTTGIPLLAQDLFHRLTTDSILSVFEAGSEADNACIDWGDDVRKLLGMSSAQAIAQAPNLESVLLRDPRVQSASVTIATTPLGGTVTSGTIAARVTTALGTFTLIVDVPSLTYQLLAGQGND